MHKKISARTPKVSIHANGTKSPNLGKGASVPKGKVRVTLNVDPDDYMTLTEMDESRSVGLIVRDLITSLLHKEWLK